jgi:hypothetical protein
MSVTKSRISGRLGKGSITIGPAVNLAMQVYSTSPLTSAMQVLQALALMQL